ncbi:DUF2471 domain-containing protein [Achromobacter xylosoxidans]|uniref:DUF2471 family protein n=1 Tax=Alcaligenes xylosoxydans xylosoxydans TaxID=85698 RepID=UPI001F053310|nr:DUF2471 family protein [Achromobacter xylosoxidans]MCH1990021.1 DUF2471 domain-containing protein [Achromobacter xylosoxidans]MCH1995438.1 DUF2471 domain-containing protein [Achromobacter xylosoxidans]MCH4589374.1 DUF2471 domain-containing protein [Achromobacter xylosoxidans]
MLHIIESVDRSIRDALPQVIARHRNAGPLTWRLLHRIQAEVLADVAATRRYAPHILRMAVAPAVMQYPTDDSVVDFGESNAIPMAFAAITDVWNRLH